MSFSIGGALKLVTGPISGIIKEVVKDKDAALKLEQEILKQLLDAESSHVSEMASIIRAEAQGESWLQRSWRPLMMLWFGVLIGMYWFGLAPDYLVNNPDVVKKLFGLIQIGLGGYVIGRSGEKMLKTVAEGGGMKKVFG